MNVLTAQSYIPEYTLCMSNHIFFKWGKEKKEVTATREKTDHRCKRKPRKHGSRTPLSLGPPALQSQKPGGLTLA